MKRIRQLVSMLLALALVFALGACGAPDKEQPDGGKDPSSSPTASEPGSAAPEKQPSEEGGPVYGGEFNLHKTTAPSTLFAIYRTLNGYGFIEPAIEMLGRRDEDTNEITPLLAEAFDYDQEANVLTIKLRDGVKFHDGSELTAEVVKWNMDFMIENGLGGNLYNPVSIECADKLTVKMQFEEAHLDTIIKIAETRIYSKQAYDEFGLDYCQTNPVGTGPFVFEEYEEDSHISFVRNENYWQEGLPYLDKYNVRIITDSAAGMAAFVNEEVDVFVCTAAAMNKAMIGEGYTNNAASAPSTQTCYGISVSNNKDDAWSDVRVRQAVLLHGIDAAAIAEFCEGQFAVGTVQPCVKGTLLYDEAYEQAAVYDVEKAKEMLKDAGYENGFETKIYTIKVGVALATVLQEQLKALNITAEIVELATNDQKRTDGSVQGMIVMTDTANFDSITKPVGTMLNPYTSGFAKHIAFSDSYIEMFDKTTSAANNEERVEYGSQLLEKLLIEESYYRNIYMKTTSIYLQDYVHDSYAQYNRFTPETTWVDAH